jgi:hypothetical protein
MSRFRFSRKVCIAIFSHLFFFLISFAQNPDSSDTTTDKTLPKKGLYFGLQIGAQFIDFEEKLLFEQDLETFIQKRHVEDSARADKLNDSTRSLQINNSRVLQPFDQVMIAFPAGIILGIPLARHLDINLSTLSFWKKQEAIIETHAPDTVMSVSEDTIPGELKNISRTYVIQSNLAGLGFKLYVPLNFLYIEDSRSVYVSYIHLWNMGGSEIYASEGNSYSGFPLSGIGYEISLGFQLRTWKQIAILGNMGVTKLTFSSSDPWSSILLQDLDEPMEWTLTSLKFNFQFIYMLGSPPNKTQKKEKKRSYTPGGKKTFKGNTANFHSHAVW